MKLEEIAREADKRPEEQPASLAAGLLHGLETPHHDVSDGELSRRMLEADEDPSVRGINIWPRIALRIREGL